MRARREHICFDRFIYQDELERLNGHGYRAVSQDDTVTVMEDMTGDRIIVRLALGIAS